VAYKAEIPYGCYWSLFAGCAAGDTAMAVVLKVGE